MAGTPAAGRGWGCVKNDSPMDNLRLEGINPFSIYLDLDWNPDISSTLDRWETSIRLAIEVNRMNNEDAKIYIGMAMIKSSLQFWQNLKLDIKLKLWKVIILRMLSQKLFTY